MSLLPPLEHVDLNLPLAGTEGHSLNYVSRIRTQYLFAQHQALLTQVQFADAKAGALITVLGLVILRGPIGLEARGVPLFLGLAFAALSAVAVFFCFWTVFPRFPRQAIRNRMLHQERWSWPALSADEANPQDFARYMQTAEVSELIHSVARSNAAVSRILLHKYASLRIAFMSSLGVLAILALTVYGAW